jgi:hypothetical protein
MMPYASMTGTRRNLNVMQQADWRLLMAPACLDRYPENAPRWPDGSPAAHALDNGAWSAHTQGTAFDEPAFLRAVASCQDGQALGSPRPACQASVKKPLPNSCFDEPSEATASLTDTPHQPPYLRFRQQRRCRHWRRLMDCQDAGADSFDGSSVTRFASTLPRLDNARRQAPLFGRLPHVE